MPQSNAAKKIILEKLRQQYEEIELAYLPGKSPMKSKQIQNDIKYIAQNKLNLKISGWGARCRAVRESRGYTQKNVAHLLGISHVNIVHEEHREDPCTVDLYYLEAFALIYRVSTFYLLGKPERYPITPIVSTIMPSKKYKNIIMGSLFVPDNEEKISILKSFITIGKMKQDIADELIDIIQKMPKLKSVLCSDISDHPMQNEEQWKKYFAWAMQNTAEDSAVSYDLRHTYIEAHLVLEDLELYNPPLLEALAKFAGADPQITKFLSDIIQIGGLVSSPKMLNTTKVDKFVKIL